MEPIPPPPSANDDISSESTSDEEMAIRRPRTRSRLLTPVSTAAGSSPLFRSFRRQRLWTADTIPIQNTTQTRQELPKLHLNRSFSSSLGPDSVKAAFRVRVDNPTGSPYTMRSDINPFVTFDDESNAVEEQSTVSSVSNDSARRIPEIVVRDDYRLPPSEIFIRLHLQHRSDESQNSSETSFPVSSWQKSWVENGGVACIQSHRKYSNEDSSGLHDQTNRPSPLLISPRNQSCNTDTTETAKYRLHAPRNMILYDSQGSVDVTFPSPASALNLSDETERDIVKNMDDMSLSPKVTLNRVSTDTTSRTSCSTMNIANNSPRSALCRIPKTPLLSPKSATRDIFVFRPLMKRAFTTQATTTLPPKPNLASRHQTSSAHAASLDTATAHILGDRPRRKPIHGSESVFSFGSIVGQSSLLTPTSPTSVSSDGPQQVLHSHPPQSPTTVKEFEQLVKANKRLSQHVAQDDSTEFFPPASRRQKSGIHQDFKDVWKHVRRLTGTNGHIDLQRNIEGRLT